MTSHPTATSQPTGAEHSAHWPKCGASALVFRGDEVLLIQRGKGGFTGLWSPPGGHIEAGEMAMIAAAREVHEETGVRARLMSLVDVHDVIARTEAGDLKAHYLVAVYCGHWLSGEPAAASDSRDARFFRPADLTTLPMTPGLARLIVRARTLVEGSG